jgi:putative membrane protein insertion efficiency factor
MTGWRPPDKPIDGVYRRKRVVRPTFSVIGVVLDFLCPLALIAIGIYCLSVNDMIPAKQTAFCILLTSAGYGVFRLKQIVLWLILIYQKYAPDYVRLACVFEPTCSEYMFQSIVKYGLVAGMFHGVKRLLRCHGANGKLDEP